MAEHLEADLFSSSPARPSHHRTQLPPSRKSSVIEPRRNPLKRTASTAALLTPPGSPEKDKSKPRSAKQSFTDSEGDDEEDDVDEEMASPGGRALRRSPRTAARRGAGGRAKARAHIAVKERRAQGRLGFQESLVFPRGMGGRQGGSKPRGRTTTRITEPVEEVDRMRLDTSDVGEPGSPEQPKTPTRSAFSSLPLPPAPTTPTRRSTRTVKRAPPPIRDSPNNPFLGSSPKAPAVSHEALEELPTMTYVFRGVKAVFRNPAYTGSEPALGAGRHGRALYPEHPDFSPDLLSAPKLLFPSAETQFDDEPSSRTRARTQGAPPPSTPPRATASGSGGQGGRGATKRRRVNEAGDGVLAKSKKP